MPVRRTSTVALAVQVGGAVGEQVQGGPEVADRVAGYRGAQPDPLAGRCPCARVFRVAAEPMKMVRANRGSPTAGRERAGPGLPSQVWSPARRYRRR